MNLKSSTFPGKNRAELPLGPGWPQGCRKPQQSQGEISHGDPALSAGEGGGQRFQYSLFLIIDLGSAL